MSPDGTSSIGSNIEAGATTGVRSLAMCMIWIYVNKPVALRLRKDRSQRSRPYLAREFGLGRFGSGSRSAAPRYSLGLRPAIRRNIRAK